MEARAPSSDHALHAQPGIPSPRTPCGALRVRLDRRVHRVARVLGAGRRLRVRRPGVGVPGHHVHLASWTFTDRGRRHVRGRARGAGRDRPRRGPAPTARRPDVGGRRRARARAGRSGSSDDALRFSGLAETGAQRPDRRAGARHGRPVGVHDLVDGRHRLVLRGRRRAVRLGGAARLCARPSHADRRPTGRASRLRARTPDADRRRRAGSPTAHSRGRPTPPAAGRSPTRSACAAIRGSAGRSDWRAASTTPAGSVRPACARASSCSSSASARWRSSGRGACGCRAGW